MLPILYSFRRCPYAIRARLALHCAAVAVELREVILADKPTALMACSPKATVPVLQLPSGEVIAESYDIMLWAFSNNDATEYLQPQTDQQSLLISRNDRQFKHALDRYKYPNRFQHEFPDQNLLEIETNHRRQAELFIRDLEQLLQQTSYLLGTKMAMADMAIWPFVRQFAFVDKNWFDAAPYPAVQRWLVMFLNSDIFKKVMSKYPPWHEGNNAVIFSTN